ncbi:uncharacterized protein LOC111064133 isoform X1 [Nilaparvata lugens]|uniref:uncharacterized protein LOC111064133 isoform X1 n=1 Tax=Nilaparvata lugens TaxID=108931 RepID=UPI00193D95B5|nr:uncharacterized protein LOC111064133 isoform X1 [Nilaparvata lugens]
MSEVNTAEILRVLEAGQNTMTLLNSLPVQKIDDNLKKEINLTAFSCQVLQWKIFRATSGEPDELWEGLAMHEYMYGKYVKHYNDINELGCTICKDMFPCTRDALQKHFESGIHIKNFSKVIFYELLDCWKNESDFVKYRKFVDSDGPSGKMFCKVCCKEVEKDEMELYKHFRENRHQELFADIVIAMIGSRCGKESGDFVFSSPSERNQSNPREPTARSSDSAASTIPNSGPSRKKSFTRKLVDTRLGDNAQKGENLNISVDSHSNSTTSNNSTNNVTDDDRMSSGFRNFGNSEPTPSSSGSRSATATTSRNSDPKRRSFTKKLVESRFNETPRTVQEKTSNGANSSAQSRCGSVDADATTSRNSDPKRRSFTKKLVESRFNETPKTVQEKTFHGANSSAQSRCGSADVDATTSRNSDPKRRSFTKKLVESRFNETPRTVQERTSNGANSSAQSRCGSAYNTSSSSSGRRILFDKIRKMSEVHRMHFMVGDIKETNYITPIGLEGIPVHITNDQIDRACVYLGDVVRVERQTIRTNVIIYIILNDRYKSIFGKGLGVSMAGGIYRILNPFLYC